MSEYVIFSFCLFLACISAACATIDSPEIVAHRGASHDAPENTLSAFRLAWQQGADAIEGDFRVTKDGKIVCIHDTDTKRVASRNMTVADSTLEELRKLDVGSWKDPQWKGERIPTVGEVLANVPEGRKILIEIKCGPEILAPLEKALAKSGLKPEQTVIVSFDANVIFEVKRQLPQLKAFWLTGFKEDKKTGNWNPSLEEILATLKKINADGLDCNAHPRVDQHFVSELRRSNMEFHAWTVNDLSTAKRFHGLGVDSLTTDHPGWMKQQLHSKEHGKGKAGKE